MPATATRFVFINDNDEGVLRTIDAQTIRDLVDVHPLVIGLPMQINGVDYKIDHIEILAYNKASYHKHESDEPFTMDSTEGWYTTNVLIILDRPK